jgi:hypothetical protein
MHDLIPSCPRSVPLTAAAAPPNVIGGPGSDFTAPSPSG